MNRTGKLTAAAFAILVVNSLYLWSTAQASIFYIGNILLHFVLGLGVLAAFVWLLLRSGEVRRAMRWATPVLLASAVLGGFLLWKGAITANHAALVAHIYSGFLGALLAGAALKSRRFWVVTIAAAIACAAYAGYERLYPWAAGSVQNSKVVPASMEEEGAGAAIAVLALVGRDEYGPADPVEVLHGLRNAAANVTRTSTSSGSARCTTSHRSTTSFIASPSNTCRTSAERSGSKWCAGCHDHAVFFNGRFDRPIKEQIDTPEAQAGLGCMSCHAIVHVAQHAWATADFTRGIPAAARAGLQPQPVVRALDAF